MTFTPDQRTHLYGALGFAVVSVVALAGYGLLAWSIWKLEWLTTELISGGGIAAVALPAAGIAVGRAVTAGRPRDVRIFAVSAGAALGVACLLLSSVGYVMFSMLENL